jgi:hypothetical protein
VLRVLVRRDVKVAGMEGGSETDLGLAGTRLVVAPHRCRDTFQIYQNPSASYADVRSPNTDTHQGNHSVDVCASDQRPALAVEVAQPC